MSETKPDESQNQPSGAPGQANVAPEATPNGNGETIPEETQSQPIVGPPSPAADEAQPENRAELLARARTFLTSPQVQYQDANAKRTFLREKGLTEFETDDLLRNLVRTALSDSGLISNAS